MVFSPYQSSPHNQKYFDYSGGLVNHYGQIIMQPNISDT